MSDNQAAAEQLLEDADRWDADDLLTPRERLDHRNADTATAQARATLALVDAVTDLMAVVEAIRSDLSALTYGSDSVQGIAQAFTAAQFLQRR